METEEEVAIKKVLQDKNYKSRELELLKQIVHPNILAVKHCFFTKSEQDVRLSRFDILGHSSLHEPCHRILS